MVLRRLVSLLALGLLVALAWGYPLLPGLVPQLPARQAETAERLSFHHYDRAQVSALDDTSSPCLDCHPAAAHQRMAGSRAFLNLHRRTLDCGVCHLRGRGLGVRHFRGDQVVTAKTLAEAPYGRVFAVLRSEGTWRKVREPSQTIALRLRGPACGECHRRGSPLLSTDGLADPYRRLVLEDLSVLRHLERL